MNEELIRKHKWFWSWQDWKQEKWLEELSLQGLHLKKPGFFGNFLFVEGSTKEYAYRLDYNRDKQPQEYIQFIQDAGWEYLGKSNGWHYWRKLIILGQVAELFTDQESKIQKYKRLLGSYVTSAPILYIFGLAIFNKYPGRHPLWFVVLFISLFMSWILFALINSVMIQLRINTIKQSKEA